VAYGEKIVNNEVKRFMVEGLALRGG